MRKEMADEREILCMGIIGFGGSEIENESE